MNNKEELFNQIRNGNLEAVQNLIRKKPNFWKLRTKEAQRHLYWQLIMDTRI